MNEFRYILIWKLDILMNIDIMNFMINDELAFAKAISDPTRSEIMTHLCCVWLSVNDVVERLGGKVKQPTVSHHLRELEEAGFVFARQEGRQRFYSLNQEKVSFCCGQLFRKFNPGFDIQPVAIATIPVESISIPE